MLKARITEAKTELVDTFAELERQSQIVDALTTSLQRSHRCWPSRWGWGLATCLMVYVIFMHSHFFAELDTVKASRTQLIADIVVLQEHLALLEHPTIPVLKKPWWQRR